MKLRESCVGLGLGQSQKKGVARQWDNQNISRVDNYAVNTNCAHDQGILECSSVLMS